VPVRFGTDGVRGAAITEVTPDVVLAIGRAVARILDGDKLLIGRDTRRSGPVLEAALAAGAAAEGVNVHLLGVLPTPAVAHLAQQERCPAAVVTASHNPFADNGVKLFAAGGRKLDDAVQERLEALLVDLGPYSCEGQAVGTVEQRPDAAASYARWVQQQFDAQALQGLRVVVDTAHGAMSDVAPAVLRSLGADVVVLNNRPDGTNINQRCGATDPAGMARSVVAEQADAGLAFDGDGDRVIAVDHTGTVVDGDRLLALSALDRRERGSLSHDTVVVTVMSNLGFHRAMAEHGIDVVTTPVGDRNVLDALDAGGYSLGGEQSGHIIHHDLAPTGDGLLAGAVLLDLVRRKGKPLAELAAAVMSTSPQVLVNVRVGATRPDVAELLAPDIERAERELGDEGRVLVRASGTEPLVRVMVEAATPEIAQRVADTLAERARGLLA
jgi:phosphoglucosamine mutase